MWHNLPNSSIEVLQILDNNLKSPDECYLDHRIFSEDKLDVSDHYGRLISTFFSVKHFCLYCFFIHCFEGVFVYVYVFFSLVQAASTPSWHPPKICPVWRSARLYPHDKSSQLCLKPCLEWKPLVSNTRLFLSAQMTYRGKSEALFFLQVKSNFLM